MRLEVVDRRSPALIRVASVQEVDTHRIKMIDGEAFLLLTQTDIVKIMSIKLGPALKIYNAILMFKSTDEGL
ncbi:Lethal(3)malignant brain tumor-like protein 1 [Bagarius yarrelli]|uniref:Lethal(3)malignant brain tumor-like protein 1 n=1 Tax=Bagarius yarrelli TaxID=175774 RepID=A0A556VVY2_BAGYA|nr:Lethal(3)malignant brain tumor-like protein 1 [Bagarius yarrelli]